MLNNEVRQALYASGGRIAYAAEVTIARFTAAATNRCRG
jgi:hypothetical protein